MNVCKADPQGWREDKKGEKNWYKGGPNYNKPHVPVKGEYDGRPRFSCLFCGRWL